MVQVSFPVRPAPPGEPIRQQLVADGSGSVEIIGARWLRASNLEGLASGPYTVRLVRHDGRIVSLPRRFEADGPERVPKDYGGESVMLAGDDALPIVDDLAARTMAKHCAGLIVEIVVEGPGETTSPAGSVEVEFRA